MNRKERRAARHNGHNAAPAPTRPGVFTEAQIYDSACQHQQAGNTAEAAKLYHHILGKNPQHFKSLQNLSVIALNAGRPDMAADFCLRALAVNESSVEVLSNLTIALNEMSRWSESAEYCRRAITLDPKFPWPHMALARALWAQGHLNDAVASYQCVLLLKPNHTEAHAYLGNLLTQLGRFDEARERLDRAVELQSDIPQTHIWLGDLHVAKGDNAGALDHYIRAMELKPDDTTAHYNFGNALMATGNFGAVIEYYEKFLAIQPKFVHGYNLLARAYNAAGNPLQAVEAARRGFAVEETTNGKSIFVDCLLNLETFGADLRELVVRAVSEPWTRPAMLSRHCVAMILANKEIAACAARATAAWPNRLPADQFFAPSGLDAMAGDEMLLAYLENSRIIGLQMEKFITALRFALLDKAISTSGMDADDRALALCCAVARQCFVSEYAFLHTNEELAKVGALQNALLTALRAGTPVSAFQVAALAAYVPLDSLAGHEALLTQTWPQSFEGLLNQQIREPAHERGLRATIPAITPIEDRISIAVRDQYEHNPYPRWVASQMREVPASISSYMQSRFPGTGFHHLSVDGPLNVLVAGCGTGQLLVDNCRFAGAHTLAVDLSLSSLSYAKRKVEALGLPNIELAQADILELGSLDRRFDVINCSGVLHHLHDPISGLRVLLSLLKPNGFMNIALYSETARADYVAAQKLVAERGYGSSPDEIRRFRSDLIGGADSPMRTGVLGCPDFYSTSECRDLLFHVQEHRMTIPQLKTIFEENDLRFIGFGVDAHIKHAYTRRFPDDIALNNLDNWHVFEQENPSIFSGMYEFWVQKGRAPA